MTNLAIPSSANAAAAAADAAASSTANTGTSGSGSAATLTQSDFLQLLTAQLKYQTPNSPADPTQLASEFAAISTVDGINQLNTQVSGLATSTGAAQMAQASALVGKQVAVSGDTLTADASGKVQGAFNLAGAAKDVSVSILAPDGTAASSIDLGALPAGQQSFSWGNGKANTQYTYQISATDSTGAAVSSTPYSVYTVEGVNLSGNTPTLNVQGSATPLPVSSIQTVLGASS